MLRSSVRRAVPLVIARVVVFTGWHMRGGVSAAQSVAGRSLPIFEVDQAWPKVLPQWRIAEPSSLAIDAQDNVWLLQRPLALVKPEDAAMAAPPVMVFDRQELSVEHRVRVADFPCEPSTPADSAS